MDTSWRSFNVITTDATYLEIASDLTIAKLPTPLFQTLVAKPMLFNLSWHDYMSCLYCYPHTSWLKVLINSKLISDCKFSLFCPLPIFYSLLPWADVDKATLQGQGLELGDFYLAHNHSNHVVSSHAKHETLPIITCSSLKQQSMKLSWLKRICC